MKNYIKRLLSLLKKDKSTFDINKERVQIIVLTENLFEQDRYFKLFHFMLRDKVEKAVYERERKEIWTDEFRFKVLRKSLNLRGYRAHYVINMTQDKEFNAMVARPIETLSFEYLKDPKFKALFY